MIIIVGIKKRSGIGMPRLILGGAALVTLVYFLKFPILAAESARGALRVCAAGLIPALFPFIVLVGILNGSGLTARAASVIGKPFSVIFGITPAASCAFLLGAVGGFPIGAVCVGELYKSGGITRDEAERLLACTGNASPAFCIGSIGGGMFADTGFGWVLYISSIISAIAVGIILRPRKRSGGIQTPIPAAYMSAPDILTSAVVSGGQTMLKICSFAVFFAVIGDAACLVTGRLAGEKAAAVCAAVCELTLAGRRCAGLGGIYGKALAAFAVGWSGLSVHMQTAAVLSGSGLGLRRYLIGKTCQGFLALLLFILYAYLL